LEGESKLVNEMGDKPGEECLRVVETRTEVFNLARAVGVLGDAHAATGLDTEAGLTDVQSVLAAEVVEHLHPVASGVLATVASRSGVVTSEVRCQALRQVLRESAVERVLPNLSHMAQSECEQLGVHIPVLAGFPFA